MYGGERGGSEEERRGGPIKVQKLVVSVWGGRTQDGVGAGRQCGAVGRKCCEKKENTWHHLAEIDCWLTRRFQGECTAPIVEFSNCKKCLPRKRYGIDLILFPSRHRSARFTFIQVVPLISSVVVL